MKHQAMSDSEFLVQAHLNDIVNAMNEDAEKYGMRGNKRAQKGDEKRSKHIKFRISESEKSEIMDYCKEKNESVCDAFLRLVRGYHQ